MSNIFLYLYLKFIIKLGITRCFALGSVSLNKVIEIIRIKNITVIREKENY